MLEINSRALPLLSISDHIARDSSCKYGALVGYRKTNSMTITDSFDLKHDGDLIDFAYLAKKLSLVQTVNGNIEFLGVYSCAEGAIEPAAIYIQFMQNGFVPSLIYVQPNGKNQYSCFALETGEEMSLLLTPGDSEVTAVSTVKNHGDYSQKEPSLIPENMEHRAHAFRQLEEHVKLILSSKPGADIENQIVYLAQLVSGYKGEDSSEAHELYASHLSILASQIATSKFANAQANIQTTAIDKRVYSSAIDV